MPQVDPKHDLLSAAKIAELLQSSPSRVAIAADAAEVAPVLRLNGIAYFVSDDAERIREKLGRAAR